MDDWFAEIPDEKRDAIIEKVAAAIARRGLETPAILFLEMNKPLTYIASQGMVVFSPFFAPFIGFENMRLASRLMEKRENVERLVRRIEELAEERRAGQAGREANDAAR